MKTVGADEQIDLARGGMIKADQHAVTSILDLGNGVTEDRLDLALYRMVDNPSCPLLKQAISSRSEGRLKPSPNREDIVDDTITTIYCLCDEFLKAIHHQDDAQVRLTTAEVMTVPLVAATFFCANLDKTRRFLHEYGYMPKMIS